MTRILALQARYMGDPASYRNPGDLQTETDEIIMLSGQQYRSYTVRNVDMWYIFASNKEYDMSEKWDWVPIGVAEDYSLDNLGKM